MKQQHHRCTLSTPSHTPACMHTPNVQITWETWSPRIPRLHGPQDYCIAGLSSGLNLPAHTHIYTNTYTHHRYTRCFHFTQTSIHLEHQTLRAFVFPLTEPQDRDGPVPCDCVPLPASRREQQLDSVMLPCSPVHPLPSFASRVVTPGTCRGHDKCITKGKKDYLSFKDWSCIMYRHTQIS